MKYTVTEIEFIVEIYTSKPSICSNPKINCGNCPLIPFGDPVCHTSKRKQKALEIIEANPELFMEYLL